MNSIKPPKVWKSFHEQLALLQARGLVIDDKHRALSYLQRIGYYRLSGYLHPFRAALVSGGLSDQFIDGSRFDDVLALYVFDKKLRLLALDALERIEVALRVDIAYLLGGYDPLAHTKPQYFDVGFDHAGWLRNYDGLVKRAQKAKTPFVDHHLNCYGALPIWVGCEIWDFGTLSKLYQGMRANEKNQIAKKYRLTSGQRLETQLHGFNFIRNVAAHHSRLWNRKMVGRASFKGLPDKQWAGLSADSPFAYFCLMRRMLQRICPNSTWHQRFLALLDEFPQVENQAVDLRQFGLTVDLASWPLWQPK